MIKKEDIPLASEFIQAEENRIDLIARTLVELGNLPEEMLQGGVPEITEEAIKHVMDHPEEYIQ